MKKMFITGVLFMSINAYSNKIPSYSNVKYDPPETKVEVLSNGIKVYIEEDNFLPVVRLSVYLKTGKVYDPADKVGLGELYFEMLRHGGSKKYSSDEIDRRLEYLGAEITAKINNEDAVINLYCKKENFDEVFDIFSDLILNPAFEIKKFELKKQEAIEVIKRRNDKASEQAIREALRMFFGKEHPYGRRAEIENIERINIDDLKNYHSNLLVANNIIIAAAGKFNKRDMLSKINSFFSMIPSKKANRNEIFDPQTVKGRKVYVIDRPLRQAFVVILHKGIKRHDPKEFPLFVLSEYMGGGIQSRLGNEIRSKRGLAYSVYSYFSKRDKSGFIISYLGTKPESVGEAITQVFKEFERAKNGEIDDKELEMAKSQLINSFVFRFENVFSLLNEKASYDIHSYPEDYLKKYTSRIDSVKKEDVINIAKEFYDFDNYLIMVVGDMKKFDKQLSEFGEVEILPND